MTVIKNYHIKYWLQLITIRINTILNILRKIRIPKLTKIVKIEFCPNVLSLYKGK